MIKKPAKKQRTRNPAQTRSRLLQATVDLVAKKGADALSMKEVAQVANVSRAVAYQHFRDREHLLSEAKTWISDSLREFVLEYRPGTMEDRVIRATRVILDNLEASKLLVVDALTGKGFKANHPLYKLLFKTLKNFSASNRARKEIDVEMLSFIMLGAVPTIIMLAQQSRRANIQVLAERFTLEWTKVLTKGIYGGGASHTAALSRPAKQRRSYAKKKAKTSGVLR